MAEHNTLTGASLHEPKGVAAATADTLYHADGGGSGDWEFQEYILNVTIPDISTAQSVFVATPYAGTVTKIYSVIDGALATADATLTFEINGTLITGGDITVEQSGSAAGTVDNSSPSAANTLAAGEAVECITDGASTNTVACHLSIVVKRSA